MFSESVGPVPEMVPLVLQGRPVRAIVLVAPAFTVEGCVLATGT